MMRLLLLLFALGTLAGCAREGTRPVLSWPRDTASAEEDVPEIIDSEVTEPDVIAEDLAE